MRLKLFGIACAFVLATAPQASAQVPAAKAIKPYAAELAHKPTPIPDRIILTFVGDPATSLGCTWRTDTTVAKGYAQVALSESGPGFDDPRGKVRPDPAKVKDVQATTTELEADLGKAHYHSVTFEGLRPKTQYVYRVGDGANWSEWFQTTTASDKPEELRFLYFGDAQNEIKSHWSRVVRAGFSEMPKAHFMLHAGDLINRANADAEWGEWFAAAGWINGMVPCVPTPGNHEYTRLAGNPTISAHWKLQFNLPANGPEGLEESCYYFDIQGVRVISLNSNEKHEVQAKWVDGVLENNPCRWTVITYHHPMYSTASSRQRAEEDKAVRVHWRPVFDKHGVDLVLQGHDHSYGRSGLMASDNVLDGTQVHTKQGTVYAVSVSGPKMYDLGEQPWMVQRGERTQLYQLVTIKDDTLNYEARTVDGKVFDGFTLKKDEKGGRRLIERKAEDRAASKE